MKKKIILLTLLALILISTTFVFYNKNQRLEFFNKKQEILKLEIEEHNKNKDFTRFEPYVGPNDLNNPTTPQVDVIENSIINKL